MSGIKPAIKLKIGAPKKLNPEGEEAPTPTSAATPKLKLKFGSSSHFIVAPSPPVSSTPKPPQAPLPAPAATKPPTKSGRKPKATPKKRALEDDASTGSEGEPLSQSSAAAATAVAGRSRPGAAATAAARSSRPPIKKLKLNNSSRVPLIKIKHRGHLPERPLGVGYDSEASDREDDPTIDEDLILRMAPGEDCEYLRQAITSGTLGLERKRGGADVRMRFLTKDSRRAVVTVRGHHYAAILVDLPCVIEAMKSWNKKDFYKSADVCQMLLVLGGVKTEEEAVHFPLPTKGRGELDEQTWQWAHGVTPPMRWARRRRFRKRISTRVVEEDEMEVERLLQEDEECDPGTSTYRHIDLDDLDRAQEDAETGDEVDDDDDADGDLDDGYGVDGSPLAPVDEERDAQPENDEDLEAHFMREMEKAEREGQDASVAALAPATPSLDAAAAAPTPPGVQSSADDNSSDMDDESDEDADDDGRVSAPDDDALEQQQDRQRMREEIADLEAAIAREEQRLKTTGNAILKQKIGRTILGLRGDLEVKMGSSGGGEEE